MLVHLCYSLDNQIAFRWVLWRRARGKNTTVFCQRRTRCTTRWILRYPHKHQELHAGRAILQPQGWPLWSQERCHRSSMLGLWTGRDGPNCEALISKAKATERELIRTPVIHDRESQKGILFFKKSILRISQFHHSNARNHH